MQTTRKLTTGEVRTRRKLRVAERLTLSIRTVEGHIYRAIAKTGVTSRGELAALLRLDLVLASLDTDQLNDYQSSSMYMVSAANLMWPLARPADAWKLIDAALPTSNPTVRESLQAFRGFQLAKAACPSEAIDAAFGLDRTLLPDRPAPVAVWGLCIDLARSRDAKRSPRELQSPRPPAHAGAS